MSDLILFSSAVATTTLIIYPLLLVPHNYREGGQGAGIRGDGGKGGGGEGAGDGGRGGRVGKFLGRGLYQNVLYFTGFTLFLCTSMQ